MIDQTKIPAELKAMRSWCLWKTVERHGKPTEGSVPAYGLRG